jgi:hypothetical protein
LSCFFPEKFIAVEAVLLAVFGGRGSHVVFPIDDAQHGIPILDNLELVVFEINVDVFFEIPFFVVLPIE